ncbi:LRAT domain-containing protein, partial [Cephalotus follicularis]
PGDHVFSFRLGGLYSHHGIYVGNGQVIHFNTPREVIAALAKENPNVPFDGEDDIWDPVANGSPGLGIVKTGIDHFGSKIYLYKYGVSWIEFWLRKRGTCCPYKSKSLKEAVDTAKEKLKTGFGTYNLLTNNCEHFATYCRTGI